LRLRLGHLDKKDIRATIFQKLQEWAQRSDLIGWVRADQSATPEVVNELARLSHENRELRSAITSAETFAALTFEELVKVMQESPASPEDLNLIRKNLNLEIQDSATLLDVFHTIFNPMSYISSYPSTFLRAFVPLKGLGLVQNKVGLQTSLELTDTGRRFRNRLLVEARRTHWEK
jgi:hypothetical protein